MAYNVSIYSFLFTAISAVLFYTSVRASRHFNGYICEQQQRCHGNLTCPRRSRGSSPSARREDAVIDHTLALRG